LLLRGGIACGSLVHSDSAIFGPAMNCAYVTESKIAKQPRIAIDETFSLLLDELNEDQIAKMIKDELIVDEVDSVKYVNHLLLVTNMVAQNMCGGNPHDILVNEKHTIESLISLNHSDPKIREKLDWYKNYFNRYIKDNPEVEITMSDSIGTPLGTCFSSITHLGI
jgi:hypothetical protein